MLGDLENKSWRSTLDLESVKNGWETLIELHVDDGTDDRDDTALSAGCVGLRLRCRISTFKYFQA